MDDEIIIIIVPTQVQRAEPDAEPVGIRRTFKGPDRFKKARRFLSALADSEEG